MFRIQEFITKKKVLYASGTNWFAQHDQVLAGPQKPSNNAGTERGLHPQVIFTTDHKTALLT